MRVSVHATFVCEIEHGYNAPRLAATLVDQLREDWIDGTIGGRDGLRIVDVTAHSGVRVEPPGDHTGNR